MIALDKQGNPVRPVQSICKHCSTPIWWGELGAARVAFELSPKGAYALALREGYRVIAGSAAAAPKGARRYTLHTQHCKAMRLANQASCIR